MMIMMLHVQSDEATDCGDGWFFASGPADTFTGDGEWALTCAGLEDFLRQREEDEVHGADDLKGIRDALHDGDLKLARAKLGLLGYQFAVVYGDQVVP